MGDQDLVICGTGQISVLAKYYFEADTDFRPVAFTADGEDVEEANSMELPVLPFDEVIAREYESRPVELGMEFPEVVSSSCSALHVFTTWAPEGRRDEFLAALLTNLAFALGAIQKADGHEFR